MSKVLVSALLLTGSVHAELALAQKPSQGAGGTVASARTGKASVKAAGKQSGKSSRAVAVRSAGKASSTAGRSHKTAVSAAAGSKKAAKTSRDAVKTTKNSNKTAQNAVRTGLSGRVAVASSRARARGSSSRSGVKVAAVQQSRGSREAQAGAGVARWRASSQGSVTVADRRAPSRGRVTVADRRVPSQGGVTVADRRSASGGEARPQLLASRGVAAVSARPVSLADQDRFVPPSPDLPAMASGSLGEAAGLNRIPDPLALRSSVALVVDPRNGKILYDKNSSAVLPIASLTKLMTAMVVLDGGQPLDEKIRIEAEDRDTERYSTSHLPVGTELTRAELMQLALMSSENRAAHALARSYPGGVTAFVAAANRKAREIGMWDSVFLDPTGLSASNVSTARDLALLVARSARYPEIRRFSVASQLQVRTAYGTRVFHTTNPLVGNQQWGLTVQKTGFINEAGNCVVMQARVNGRQMIIVLLDSQGRYSRVADANRIRRFLEG